MKFRDRQEAGEFLAGQLARYKDDENVVVLALPRGGVVTAAEIAKSLHAPLDLVITRKIGHPDNPEYAIAAVTQNGTFIGVEEELKKIDDEWLNQQIEKERNEAKRRKDLYLRGKKSQNLSGKTVILVDDGIATGLTMQAAVKEVSKQSPKKIIIATPVIPEESYQALKQDVDTIVTLIRPTLGQFLGAIGAYYKNFIQITDRQVIDVLKSL